MDDKKQPTFGSDDSELEREIRTGREFSPAEAIGRAGGGELLKGASPVSRRRQAELAIEQYLEDHLDDVEGAIAPVLLQRVALSPFLHECDNDEPLAALARTCEELLDAGPALQEFVTAVDAQWGRMYDERPRFQQEGEAPAADDPYTVASVRAALSRLVAELRD